MNPVNVWWSGAVTLSSVPQVYYITCPEITKSFTHFPTTPTGAEVTSIEQATGTCVPHAREESPPSFLCTGDGQWSLLNGGCACLPGYQADTEKQSCDGEYPLPCTVFLVPLCPTVLPDVLTALNYRVSSFFSVPCCLVVLC